VREWQSGDHRILIVPKARRMMLTWTAIACQVWLAWSRPHANIFLVSDKLDKSAELIERARGIIARLPATVDGPWPEAPPEVRFPNGSWMLGIAEGAGQLRQFSASSIFADEFAHWVNPRESYSAFLPCTEGGGRVLIVSSAAPGYFRDLCSGEALGG
jgi:phage FluMu gp28-like protein